MHFIARVLRRPSWLATLGLLFVGLVGASDPAAAGVDDRHDARAVHATITAAQASADSGDLDNADRDDHGSAPALAAETLAFAPPLGGCTPAVPIARPDSCDSLVRLRPRAPPSVLSHESWPQMTQGEERCTRSDGSEPGWFAG
jgi:hypothetical protein